VGFAVIISSSLVVYGTMLIIVRFFLDPVKFAEVIGNVDYLAKYADLLSSGSTFAIAYALYKATMPFRYAFTFWFTPRLARYLRLKNIIK
jgi:hypothetical protein